jgi:hypothetical protein
MGIAENPITVKIKPTIIYFKQQGILLLTTASRAPGHNHTEQLV